MASTKEMMARAKARKQIDKSVFNEIVFTEMMIKVSDAIVKDYPDQDYSQTDITLHSAQMIVDHFGLTGKHLNQFLNYRVKYEASIKRRFGVDLATGVSAFGQDQEAVLKQHNAPQRTRVFCGMLDTLIAVIAIRSGALEVA